MGVKSPPLRSPAGVVQGTLEGSSVLLSYATVCLAQSEAQHDGRSRGPPGRQGGGRVRVQDYQNPHRDGLPILCVHGRSLSVALLHLPVGPQNTVSKKTIIIAISTFSTRIYKGTVLFTEVSLRIIVLDVERENLLRIYSPVSYNQSFSYYKSSVRNCLILRI